MALLTDAQFRAFVTDVLGYTIVEVPPNGNSLFVALALGLFYDGTHENVVRMTTHYYIGHHWDQFTEHFADNAAMEAGVAGLLVNVFPDPGFVLLAVSMAFQANVILWNYTGPVRNFAPAFDTEVNISVHPGEHYNFMYHELLEEAGPFGPAPGEENDMILDEMVPDEMAQNEVAQNEVAPMVNGNHLLDEDEDM